MKETLEQKVKRLEMFLSASESAYDEMKKERDALSAHVNNLRVNLKNMYEIAYHEMAYMLDRGDENDYYQQMFDSAKLALEGTHYQNLETVVRKAFIAGCSCGDKYGIFEWDRQADEYAQHTKQGEWLSLEGYKEIQQ